jgi:hypothetical protein
MQLQEAKVDPAKLKMPDLAPGTELSSEQWNKNVADVAAQLVDVKVGALASVLEKQLTRREGAGTALREVEAAKSKYKALDSSDDEYYDRSLNESIDNGFYEIFKNNPNYSYAEHVKLFEPVLKAAEQTAANNGTDQGVSNRGTAANRSSASSRRTQKAPGDMDLDELETHIHSMNR